jgi:hypothetical protein
MNSVKTSELEKAAEMLMAARDRRPDLTFELDAVWMRIDVANPNYAAVADEVAVLEQRPIGPQPTDADFSKHGYRSMTGPATDEEN